ncbi:MAG: DUF169 domain-containing protein [Deltaproteobacteria bacterium]|jgi:uncharacterized protein (DUF169 family)|nr:DUF169 domain-containing protein [Deltaproteobacteria bacterium]
MTTYLEKALELHFPPLAIYYAQQLPDGCRLTSPMCSMILIAQAAKGQTVALSKDSCRCHGAASGFGLDALHPENFPGGTECFLRFLSIGNSGWEYGQGVIAQLKEAGAPKILIEEFSDGEGFCKTPELVQDWVDSLPEIRSEGPFVIISPLENVQEGNRPKVVSLLVNADQLSALVVLANYARKGSDHVRIPFGAGCYCFGFYAFVQAEEENPGAIIGLTDISARYYLHKTLGKDILSFTVPLSMFEEIEANAPESFLVKYAWKTMMKKNQT